MLQKDMNEENKEIKSKAYELYKEHGFKDGNDFVDWLEAEKQLGKQTRAKRSKQTRNLLLIIVAILCLVRGDPGDNAVQDKILIWTLPLNTRPRPSSWYSYLTLRTMRRWSSFGDTHFDFDNATLSQQAKTLLDKDVQVMKENPLTNVRMAGYTSAEGSEEVNQALSERRANAVRDYLIEEGIATERITVIGYGRTKPAVYEVRPGDINSKEARANMRVLFEIVVK